jgi:hypothetical protein
MFFYSINHIFSHERQKPSTKVEDEASLMYKFNCTHKRTSCLQYSVCKCKVESTGNSVVTIDFYLN